MAQRLSQTKGYVVAKMQERFTLHYSPKPYLPHLRQPEGAHHRNVPHRIVKLLLKDRVIEAAGRVGNTTIYKLTKKGEEQ